MIGEKKVSCEDKINLMYITNKPLIAKIALEAGVNIIFVDMEYMGKEIRQGGMDTVKNYHTLEDIKIIRDVIDEYGDSQKLLVRVNPIHEKSKAEIDTAIDNGADIIMLPMWKTIDEVKRFIGFVDKRAEVCLLLETKEAVGIIDNVLQLGGIDCIYIGLNDLHLSYKMKFMFQPLINGIVDRLMKKIKNNGIRCGFGGIAKLHQGKIPAEKILGEHIRLKSDVVILSRSFCNSNEKTDLSKLRKNFISGVAELRDQEMITRKMNKKQLEKNHSDVKNIVKGILRGNKTTVYVRFFKRFIDVFLCIFALIVLMPILLIVAAAIKIESEGPIIFKQKRLGKDGKEFEIYKFRSMCQGAEGQGTGQYSFKSDPRVTKVGRIIRACSVDELPQLINIIRGDMSIVGFRPPLTYHPWPIEEYTTEQKVMFNLRPGITGWAQIHGRKCALWEDRIDMGVWYANNVSFWLDVKILFITVFKVLTNADNENNEITSKKKEQEETERLIEKV